MSNKTKEPSTYAAAGREMAKAAKKAKASPKPAEKKVEVPLAPWLRGDRSGLPMKPPGKEDGK